MQQLTAISRRPVPNRADFAGIVTGGDSKSPLRLYSVISGTRNSVDAN